MAPFLIPRAVNAADALTPEAAVEMALQKNYALVAGGARVTGAEGLRVQAGLRPNPRLVLQSENTRFNNPPPFKYIRDADTFAYLTQVFETAGKRDRRIDVANQNITSTEAVLAAQRFQLIFRVLAAYWTAVSARQAEASLAQGVSNLEQTVQYHRDRVREGALPESDLIRIQLEYQQLAISFQNAQQDTRRLQSLLFREIGTPGQPGVTLTGNLDAVPPISVSSLEDAVERRPDVQLARRAVEQAQSATRLQKALAYPDPEVLFGYKRTAGFDTLIAGFQINLPVRNRNQGSVAAARADQTGAAASLTAARIAARTEIETLQREYDQKRQVVNQMIPTMRNQSAETIRIADAVYREGGSDLLRLLDAQRIRLQTEALYIRTVSDYRQAALNLQAAIGLLP